jgi:hypothetical protein
MGSASIGVGSNNSPAGAVSGAQAGQGTSAGALPPEGTMSVGGTQDLPADQAAALAQQQAQAAQKSTTKSLFAIPLGAGPVAGALPPAPTFQPAPRARMTRPQTQTAFGVSGVSSSAQPWQPLGSVGNNLGKFIRY